MTSPVRSNPEFDNLSSLALPGKVAASSWNKTDDHVWDSTLRSTLLSLWEPLVKSKVIRDHEVKKNKMWIFGLGGKIPVFRSDFGKERENDPKTLPVQKKTKIEKMPKSPILASKVAFLAFKMAKRSRFQDIDLKFFIITHRQVFYFPFLENKNGKFANDHLFLPNFPKIQNPR